MDEGITNKGETMKLDIKMLERLLHEAFDKAENDTAEKFNSQTCSMKNKDGNDECPICFFRLKVKEYMGLDNKDNWNIFLRRMDMDKPVLKVGMNVHYVAYGTPGGEFPAGVHRAAIVTEIDKAQDSEGYPYVGLCVLNPTGMFFNRHIPYDETATKPGSWHFQE